MFSISYEIKNLVEGFIKVQENKSKREFASSQKANELKEKQLRIECAKNGLDYDKI